MEDEENETEEVDFDEGEEETIEIADTSDTETSKQFAKHLLKDYIDENHF